MASSANSAADAPAAVRRPVLEGRAPASHSTANVAPGEPAARLALRAPSASLAALAKALGLSLPQKPKTSVEKDGRAALWLGPDEWLLIGPDGDDLAAACAGVKPFHSAVDVSHRNVAIIVTGAGAEATIAAGCPQDLSLAAFPVGACSRTLLGLIEIVLWRTGEDAFRVECWRSFADYAFTFLSRAAKDAAA